jgi:hypothetical protein
MTILKKLLFITSLIVGNSIYPASLHTFDANLLTPYVEKAEHAFAVAHETIQWLDHGPREILVTSKPIAKKLYSAQKSILKSIKKELKHTAQLQKNSDLGAHAEAQQLYKAFKHDVYKSWKTRVKAGYQESKKSNDPHAWGWIHHQKLIVQN